MLLLTNYRALSKEKSENFRTQEIKLKAFADISGNKKILLYYRDLNCNFILILWIMWCVLIVHFDAAMKANVKFL